MSAFCLTSTNRFSTWYCILLLISSSVSGFTTTSAGGNSNCSHNNRNQYRSRRPHLRCGGIDFRHPPFQQRHERRGCWQPHREHADSATSMRLHLSFPTEVPIASEMVSTYAYFLKYHYFPTQSITNAILTVAGDGIAQTQEAIRHQASNDCDNKEDVHTDVNRSSNQIYDPKRGLVYFFKGLGSGIMWAWWFDMADVLSMELTESALSYGSGIDGGSSSSFQEAQEVIDFATSATVLAGTAANDGLSVAAQTIRTAINIFLEQFLVCPILFTLWDIPVTSTMRGCPAEQVPTQIREKLLPLLVANAKVWTLVNVVTYNIPLEYRLLFTSAASIVSESINSGITSKQVVVPETPKPPPIVANPVTKVGMGASVNSAAAATVAAVVPLGSSGGINAKNITILEL